MGVNDFVDNVWNIMGAMLATIIVFIFLTAYILFYISMKALPYLVAIVGAAAFLSIIGII